MKKVDDLRSANDLRHQIIQQDAARRTVYRNASFSPIQSKPIQPQLSKEAQIAHGRQEIEANFNPYSDEIAYDRFGRRWVQCRVCKRIVPSEECPMYGGRGATNIGICYDCSRK